MKIEPEGTELEVCEDIARRQAHGIAKYGTTVERNPLTLKQWLQHAYEETLDKAVYLKRTIQEIEKTEESAKEFAKRLSETFGGNALSTNQQIVLVEEQLIKWRGK